MDLDLLIVGAGPVGLSLACALAGRTGDLRVGLVAGERPRPPAPAEAAGEPPDARVYALSPGNVAFLRRIGAWQQLDHRRVTPVRAMRIHGDEAGARLEFDAYAAGVPELAWTVEDRLLNEALWRALEQCETVRVHAPARCESFEPAEKAVRVRLQGGAALAADLVAAADGADSFIRRQAGIEAKYGDYGQSAVVANFECENDHADTARQWFQGGGVLALLPLPGRRVSMIWSLPSAEAASTAALDPDALCRALERATHGETGALSPLTAARSYPLRRLSARRMIGSRLALLGDAAHVVHPLAGQGLNLGLQDVRQLAHLLTERGPRAPADERLLRTYERRRAEPILAMDLVVDGLFRLFGASAGAARLLRNTGLNLTDRLAVIKNILIRQAMA